MLKRHFKKGHLSQAVKFVNVLRHPTAHATPPFHDQKVSEKAYFQTDMCDEKEACAIELG